MAPPGARYTAVPTTPGAQAQAPPPASLSASAGAGRWVRLAPTQWSLGARAVASFALVYVLFVAASAPPQQQQQEQQPSAALPSSSSAAGWSASTHAEDAPLDPGVVASSDAESATPAAAAATDPWCAKPLRFLPTRGGANVTLLSSYPGSGNTWVRHLIELGTRAYTGSAYNDSTLRGEFRGEARTDASVVAVKTHYPCGGCWKQPPNYVEYVAEPLTGRRSYAAASASVLILRNPFDAILSEFNRVRSGFNHTGTVDAADLATNAFVETVRRRVLSWRRHTTFYLTRKLGPRLYRDENGNLAYLVLYESLRDATEKELVPVFEFLKRRRPAVLAGMDPRVAARCAVGDVVGRFRRPKPARRADPFDRPFAAFPIPKLTFAGQTNPTRPDETLRGMVCRVLRGLWHEDVWGECDPRGRASGGD